MDRNHVIFPYCVKFTMHALTTAKRILERLGLIFVETHFSAVQSKHCAALPPPPRPRFTKQIQLRLPDYNLKEESSGLRHDS